VQRKLSEEGGGFTFEEELLGSILKLAATSRHELVLFSPYEEPLPQAKAYEIETVRVRFVLLRKLIGAVSGIINQFFSEVLHLPHLLRTEDWIDPILFKHRIGFFLNLTPLTLTKEIPYLIQVWDLQHRIQPYFPEVSAQGRWARWEARFSTMLGRATFIVVPSPAGKDQVQQFYGIPDQRIRVLPFPTPGFALAAGGEANCRWPDHLNINEEYVFYPAQFGPHKNHATILRAMTILRDEYSYRPHAVFVGSDRGNLDYVKQLGARFGLTEQLHFLGFVSREELIALYQNAAALVFPSMFGPGNLPPLEAFALGCPVVAADISSAEQLQDAALIVESTDERAFAAAIYDLHTQPALRESLIKKGHQRAAGFSGEDFARGIFSLLDEFEKVRQCWSQEERHDIQFRWRRLFSG